MPPACSSARAGRACSAVEPIQPSSSSCPTLSSSVASLLQASATARSVGAAGAVDEPAPDGEGAVPLVGPAAAGADWSAPGEAGADASPLGAEAAPPVTTGGCGLMRGWPGPVLGV